MNVEEKRGKLASYRIQQAKESLDEAVFLYQGGKSQRSVINRAYYSMFYSILALLIFEPFSSSKHSGVISYFNQRFVKTGEFPREIGRAVNKAFDLRQRSDYKEEVVITKREVEPFLKQSKEFVDLVEKHLQEKGWI